MPALFKYDTVLYINSTDDTIQFTAPPSGPAPPENAALGDRTLASASSNRRGPGRPRRPQTDAAILDAALELFIEHGLEGASFERIARASGIARATIYRRWRTREALLADALGRLKETAEQEFGAWRDMPLEQLVAAMVDYGPKAWVDLDARRLLARIAGSLPEAPELTRIYWEVHVAPRRAAFDIIIERARREGVLPADTDVDMFQDVFGGAMLYRLLLKPEENTEEALRAYFIRLLRQIGLGAMVPDDAAGRGAPPP